jgi:DNA-binding NtrC family response regulator
LPDARRGEACSLESALRGAIDVTQPYGKRKGEVVQAFRKVYVQMLLEHTCGNQSEASRLSGLERSYLNKVVKKLGIGKKSARAHGSER